MVCRSCGLEKRLRGEDITDEIEKLLAYITCDRL